MQSSIVKNTISLLISKLIPSILLTIINIIYSRYLLQSEYGVYQTVWSYLSIFTIISTFGLPRYILTHGSLYNYSKSITVKLIVTLFALTLIPIIGYLTFYDDTFSVTSIFLFLILLISQSLYLIQEANILKLNANKILINSNGFYAITLFISQLVVLHLGYSIDFCLITIATVSIIRNGIIFYLIKEFVPIVKAIESIKEKYELLWFGINDTLQIITKWIDKIVLIVLLTSSDYAVYFNGTYEIPLIGIGLSIFQTIQITQSSKPESTDTSSVQLFNSSSIFMSGILFPLFSFCFVFSDEIINLLFSSKYMESANLFAISAILLPMRICNYTVLLQLKNKGKTILIGSLIDISVAVILMIVLYPIWGLKGLALSIIVATYIQAIYYLIKIKLAYKTTYSTLLNFPKLLFRLLIVFMIFISTKYIFNNKTEVGFLIAIINFILLVLLFNYKHFIDLYKTYSNKEAE